MPSRTFQADADQAGIAIDGLRALFDGLDEGVVLITAERLIAWVNPAAEALFGYAQEELLGHPVTCLHADLSGDRRSVARATLFDDPDDRRANEWFRRRDGSVFISRTTQSPVTSGSGQILGHMSIIRDASRQYALANALSDLYAVSCNPDLSSDKKVGSILDIGRSYFDLPIGIVNLIEGGRSTIVHSASSTTHLPRGATQDLYLTFCSHTVCSNDATAFHEASASSTLDPVIHRNSGIEAYIGIPLIVDGDRFGTLCFMGPTPKVPFTDADLELIKLFAAWVSQEMSRRQAMKLLEDAARYDPLTGALNRGAFDKAVAAHLERDRPRMVESSLLIIDLDHFKVINDTHGHDAGDKVLIAVAQRLLACMGPADILGRIGGEEFAVLLHGLDGDRTLRQAEALRATIADRPISVADTALTVTASIGVADLGRGRATIGDWMKAGDDALYHAKRTGRNRCHKANSSPNPQRNAANG